ncbi:MAG: family metallopeptidase [Clostridia bacterium]|jgi:endoglucanase|uniref:M42 family metallopeptidase n=1 Tax=Petroclostridium xylanilyticum TaxID=1792311 RepID=UPI000B98AC41|nr:M42 family metallopeptidase [Petroclostridium xylanilyticum]MBZ4645768.1 family metallopeptidase [Clostridia bacterium]
MLLKKLTEAIGVSGNEKAVRDIIIKEIGNDCENIAIDRMGNLIALKKGTEGNGKKVMLAAHMDEVGLIVTGITDTGFIKFKPVGGIDARILVSKKVVIGDNRIPGVIGLKAIHLQEPGERKQAVKVKNLYIDIGAKNKEDAEKKVNLGDYIGFDSSCVEFGNNLVKAKALDDRVGCAILIEMLKERYTFDLYACFTVQEEVGLRGAGVAAYTVSPDLALVVEGTTCSDVPGAEEHEHATTLGHGPAVSIMDRASYSNKGLSQLLYNLGKDNNIKVQYKRTTFGGNDAGKIHLTREGIPTAAISVPCRYIHSPVSVMNLDDYEGCKKIVRLFLHEIGKKEINKWEEIK